MTGNEKLLGIYFKKLFFQSVLVFIDHFYRYRYPRYFIYSYCMWRHVRTCNSIIFTVYRKSLFIYEEFFSVDYGFYCTKNKSCVSHLN